MANYLVTDPQGVRYKVTAPDDATPEQVQTYAQQNMGGGAPAETRSLGQEAVRQAGLGARTVAEGVSSPFTAVGDMANKLLNIIPGIKLGMPSQMVHEALTKIGLPLPESNAEKLSGAIGGAVAGQGGIMKAAGALPEAYAATRGLLTSNAGAQGVSAAGAGAGGELARQNDMGPMGQLVASLAGGVVTPVTMLALQQIAKAAGRGVANLSAPFTEAGQQKVVGNTLDRFASNPTQARANLQDVPEYVEGSTPTSAQAARDPGLIQLERTLANKDSQFATRESQNNAARNQALSEVARTPDDLKAAVQTRSDNAAPQYEAAYAKGLNPDAQIGPLLELSQRPAFKDAVKEAARIAADNGEPVDNLMTSVKGLHYVKMALDDALSTAPQKGIGAAQQRGIAGTRDKLLEFLDQASPEYQQARAGYRADSAPVNQMETAQAIQQKTAKMGPDVTGDARISQAKWQTNVTNKIAELGKTLTPEQVDTMKRIGQDLDRASLSETAGRAVGSNTTQNLSSANLLGQVVGNKVAKSPLLQSVLARPLNWLYKIPEAQIQDLLTQAMLDPMTARVMLTKATPANIEMMGGLLRDRARAMALAGSTQSSVGTEQAQQ